jgi:hypothetical protein
MRLIFSTFVSCALLIAARADAQPPAAPGDEFAASRRYCDAQWPSRAAASAAAGQSHAQFTLSCVCDHRFQEKIDANIGTVQSREKDRRQCLHYQTGSDVPEYAFFGGATLALSLIGLTASDGHSGDRAVSP